MGLEWVQAAADKECLQKCGIRLTPGGIHLSKTMMLLDLNTVLRTPTTTADEVCSQVLEGNVLRKRTGAARRQALANLNGLYGIITPRPITTVMAKLWPRRSDGHPLLALLCCLAREPLLRESADSVLLLLPGERLFWPEIAEQLGRKHPGRYSPKMLGSLARNCASTWTQAGLISGKVRKQRVTPAVTPEAAAYAALIGALAGFGGPALLTSPWMRVLDRSEPELLNLLRAADGLGLLRLRVGGGVIDLNVVRPMADTLGVPDLVNG